MDRKTARKLVKRLSLGRVGKGDEAKKRRRILDDLYSAGIATDEAASLSQDELESRSGHTLVAWARETPQPQVDLFVVPDGEIDDGMRNALDAVNELEFAGPRDCSLLQYGSALRVMAALGLGARDHEAFVEEQIAPVYEEMSGDRDLEWIPAADTVERIFGRWRAHHVGRDAIAPGSLDRRLTHSYGIRQTD